MNFEIKQILIPKSNKIDRIIKIIARNIFCLINSIFDNEIYGTLLVDQSNRKIIQLNKTLEQICGYTKYELIGQSTRIFYENEGGFLETLVQYTKLERGEKIEFIRTFIGKNGKKIHVIAKGKKLFFLGVEIGVLWGYTDISSQIEENKIIVGQLSELSSKLNFLENCINKIGIPIFIKRIDGIKSEYIIINDLYIDFFGFNRQELIGNGVEALTDDGIKDQILEQELELLNSYLNGGTGYKRFDTEFKTRRGIEKKYRSLKQILEINGEYFLVGSIIDISLIHKLQNKIIENFNIMEKALLLAKSMGFEIDLKTLKIKGDKIFLEYFGLNYCDDGIGLNEISYSTNTQLIYEIFGFISSKINGNEKIEYILENEIEIKDKDGNINYFIVKYDFLNGQNGVPIKINCSIINITDIKKVETLYKDAINIMLHDIKNPISGIVQLSELIEMIFGDFKKGNLSLAKFLELLNEYIIHLELCGTRLMNDISILPTILNLQRGNHNLLTSKFNIIKIITNLLFNFHSTLVSRNIHVTININGETIDLNNSNLEIDIYGEKNLIVHCLENLIKNAIESGTKIIRINIKNDDKNFYIIEVINYGDIDQKDLKMIFNKKFSKGKKNGTGFGLYISKIIIDAHHGKIECIAEKGEIKFTIKLPKPHII